MGYNFDSWVGIINLANQMNLNDKQYLDLAESIMQHFKEFPLPMHDLLSRFSAHIGDYQIVFNNELHTQLLELSKINVTENTTYFQAQAVKDIANYLLGIEDNNNIASFSFDGENPMELRLEGTFREQKTKFEYSFTADRNNPTNDKAKNWTEVTDGRAARLRQRYLSARSRHRVKTRKHLRY